MGNIDLKGSRWRSVRNDEYASCRILENAVSHVLTLQDFSRKPISINRTMHHITLKKDNIFLTVWLQYPITKVSSKTFKKELKNVLRFITLYREAYQVTYMQSNHNWRLVRIRLNEYIHRLFMYDSVNWIPFSQLATCHVSVANNPFSDRKRLLLKLIMQLYILAKSAIFSWSLLADTLHMILHFPPIKSGSKISDSGKEYKHPVEILSDKPVLFAIGNRSLMADSKMTSLQWKPYPKIKL